MCLYSSSEETRQNEKYISSKQIPFIQCTHCWFLPVSFYVRRQCGNLTTYGKCRWNYGREFDIKQACTCKILVPIFVVSSITRCWLYLLGLPGEPVSFYTCQNFIKKNKVVCFKVGMKLKSLNPTMNGGRRQESWCAGNKVQQQQEAQCRCLDVGSK